SFGGPCAKSSLRLRRLRNSQFPLRRRTDAIPKLNQDLGLLPGTKIQSGDLIIQSQILPPEQRDRQIAILPQLIVKIAKFKPSPLLLSGICQKPVNLKLANLVSDRLPRHRGEKHRLSPGRLVVHWCPVLQILRRPVDVENAERELHVDLNSERTQSHKVANDLARLRTVVEQAGVEHQLLRIKPYALVRTRIIVVPADVILMGPGQ